MRPAAALASWIIIFVLISTRWSSSPASPSSTRRHLLGLSPSPAPIPLNSTTISSNEEKCPNPAKHPGSQDPCSFIRSHPECNPTSGLLLDYTELFYCRLSPVPWLAYTLLGLWLASLFYMLGNTAADFFCCSLRKLSGLLHLPPTVAGVSLLPLGNGAPDVFASIAAFVGAGAGEVGLNSVLGGAVFVTSVVAGLVYTITAGKSVQLDRTCFIRDICFFLFSLLSLGIILRVGKIGFWGSVAFISIYVVYGVSVAASEVIRKQASRIKWRPMQALVDGDEESSWYSPLLDPDSGEDSSSSNPIEITLPQWRWASNVAIYAHQQAPEEAIPRPLWGWSEQQEELHSRGRGFCGFLRVFSKVLIDGPLTLPRQLTIPIVEDSRWSRPLAIASVSLSPILLALLLNDGFSRALFWGVGLGLGLGVLAFLTTISDHPPRKFLFPWVAAGFVMSIVWFYIIARELVAVLVSLGLILEIDSSVLGLTVLAWGNSMGDLMANVAMAYDGGDGVQVAVSGCYAGPMFNTLAGLGVSLLLASLKSFPEPFVIPGDPSLFYTIGFLVVGLLWTLVILPAGRMQPSRVLGVGLLVLYSLFLVFRIIQTSGSVSGQ